MSHTFSCSQVFTHGGLFPEGALPEAEAQYQPFMNTCKGPEIVFL